MNKHASAKGTTFCLPVMGQIQVVILLFLVVILLMWKQFDALNVVHLISSYLTAGADTGFWKGGGGVRSA